jgi:salicylate hydroxylase
MAGEKILIVGAGLGGLAAASCLLKAGFDVEVYEQAPALGEVGAGIQMSANPMHVLRHLGLEDDVLRLGVQPGAYVFRLHDTGEVIQEFSLADAHRHQHGAPYVQLHRADLHDLLASAACKLKPDLIRLNRKATGFTETDRGVTLHLADGSSVAGDILIGADGLKSTIARQIVGEIPATYTGDAAWRITVPVERLPKPFLPQVMSLFLGPGGHAVCYYLRGGALLNFVGCVETELAAEESWTQKFPWDLLQKDYEGWHPAVQAIVDAVDKDQCYRWSMHNRPPVRNWSTRRATILGDAAHATLPYLAQGAAMAIEDGAVLARALKQAPSIAEGLDLYQRNRVDRTARIVEQSTQNRWLFHLPSQQAMRDEFSKRNQGEERNRWLYSYNPLTVELT